MSDTLSFSVVEPDGYFTPASFLNAFADDPLLDHKVHCLHDGEVPEETLVRLSYLGSQSSTRTYVFSYPRRTNPHERILLRLPSHGTLLIEVVSRGKDGLVWAFRNIKGGASGECYEIIHNESGFSIDECE